jgi:hypothetical protein
MSRTTCATTRLGEHVRDCVKADVPMESREAAVAQRRHGRLDGTEGSSDEGTEHSSDEGTETASEASN